ncbi:MAG: alpha/beta hydrolase [Deltaproteobacteria bacterium]|nr:alpha/beta hydrolase [Deltaproteobacteria bacterium]
MSYANANGVKLYVEETGNGYPVVFVHEFAADHREWESQVRYFSRNYRCITYAARGYTPSDVPDDPAAYHYTNFADDIGAVMRHCGVAKAHIVGLSQGAYATLMFGLRHPDMASALVAAGVGSGSPREQREDFRTQCAAVAQRFLSAGMQAVAEEMGVSPTRVQLQNKDPRGWRETVDHLSQHSAKGSSLTMRNFQGERPSLYDFAKEFSQLTIPTLVVVGDEDEPCIETSVFLKRAIPSAGLFVQPRTGHAINLEEPAAFNREIQEFFSTVERGKWGLRDARAAAGVKLLR